MENKEAYLAFLEVWNQTMWFSFLGSLALAAIFLIVYKIKYWSAGGYKEKFEIASTSEISSYLLVSYTLGAAIFFISNTAKPEIIQLSIIWFFIRVFISLCIGTLHGYISHLIFRFYYPGQLDKKLKRLRYTPRINPATGNTMKLLSESEEDSYLDEGMQAEENAFSVDYDVWRDEQTGETHIEKYKGHLSALECDRCGFQTLKLEKEEILKKPTAFADGEIEKEYKCGYCGRIKRKTMKLTSNLDKEAAYETLDIYAHDHQIEVIKIEIHDRAGETKIFEFQNRDQAKLFLDEFDFSKLRENTY
jgi:hypothetical protein